MNTPKCLKDTGALNFDRECKPRQDKQSFEIISFIKENHQLFTVIGIIGTLLALLPNFIEKFIGSDWKLSLLADQDGMFLLIILQVTIISGAFFILLIFIGLIAKSVKFRSDEEDIHTIFKFKIKSGDVSRLAFYLFFIPTFSAFILFTGTICIVQEDMTIKFIQMIIISVYILFLSGLVASGTILELKRIPGLVKTLGFLIVVILVIAGVANSAPIYTSFSSSAVSGTTCITVMTANSTDFYSSDFRIQIKPDGNFINLSGFDPWYLRVRWTTNYGSFVITDKHKSFYKDEGPELVYDFQLNNYQNYVDSASDLEIYWTYDFKDREIEKPPVDIYLRVEDVRTGKVITSTKASLSWVEHDIPIVENGSIANI